MTSSSVFRCDCRVEIELPADFDPLLSKGAGSRIMHQEHVVEDCVPPKNHC